MKGQAIMTTKAKPSIFRIIQSDFLAMLGILVPAVSLLMYIAVAYFGYFPGFRGHDPIQGTDGAPLFLYMFLAGIVIGLPLAYWRIRSILEMFSRNVEVVGQITGISFFRDRGQIQFTYNYFNQAYSGVTAIMKTRRTEQLQRGQEVILLIDPNDPKRALIRDLYV